VKVRFLLTAVMEICISIVVSGTNVPLSHKVVNAFAMVDLGPLKEFPFARGQAGVPGSMLLAISPTANTVRVLVVSFAFHSANPQLPLTKSGLMGFRRRAWAT
jgi:hypothetical protein